MSVDAVCANVPAFAVPKDPHGSGQIMQVYNRQDWLCKLQSNTLQLADWHDPVCVHFSDKTGVGICFVQNCTRQQVDKQCSPNC